ncbi:MAG: hypothetical protein LUC34_04725 [Campylobacter sp.]|nr:hypothetical protein [Campylobacter sp.]
MNYEKGQDARQISPGVLSGKILRKVLAQAVADEINQIYILADESWFVISPLIGGEILGIFDCDEPCEREFELKKLPVLSCFEGLKIHAVDELGKAWAGFGYEISFEDIFDKTLIVGSIYGGNKPSEFEDCLRVGVASYVYKI